MLTEPEPVRQTRYFPVPPRSRHLLIVRRDEEAVYRHLAEAFRGVHGIAVILDRRHLASPAPAERRRARSDFDVFGVRLVRS